MERNVLYFCVLVPLVLLSEIVNSSQPSLGIVYDQSGDQTIGQPCQFQRNGTHGICISIRNCPQVYIELHFLHIIPTACWFNRDVPVVCCLPATNLPSHTRKSAQMCTNVYSTSVDNVDHFSTFEPYPIVGGTKVGSAEYPHMAALGWSQPNTFAIDWKCGGSLISEEYVMTAAHCTSSRNVPPDVIRIGEKNLRTDDSLNTPNDYSIKDIIVHPDYRGGSYYNDIALIKLNAPITITRTIRPACLWQTKDFNFTSATATGYGHTEFAGIPSDSLLKADLDMYDNKECADRYGKERLLNQGILESQVCAGDETGERDTCQGDSGGPLQINTMKEQQIVYHILGVTSFGKGCATKQPGVYTRVSYYLDWIESIVWP